MFLSLWRVEKLKSVITYVVVVIFIIVTTFLPSLFSEYSVHQSAKCVHMVIKPNHHLHSSLNITKAHKATLILKSKEKILHSSTLLTEGQQVNETEGQQVNETKVLTLINNITRKL